MADAIPGVKTGIKYNEIRAIYEIPSPFCDRVYLTQKDGSIRITFSESIPELDGSAARVSATVSISTLSQMSRMIEGFINNILEQQKRDTPLTDVEAPKPETMQ